ncbi:hypothetical protein HORIV_01400 [Vreelandella olivaria]|uniref:HAMP domain-containing protein n=1 Tax=Vreelandella olivaria TaxID=390919 RepID=A0ABM7GBC5_9GAMM|nr:hypothetical protein HORIV_01400 [Halomonas olivaria]
MANALMEDFNTVMALVKQQHETFEYMDLTRYNTLREELEEPLIRLSESMTAFVDYGFQRVDTIRADAEAQTNLFNMIKAAAVLFAMLMTVVIYFGLRRTVIAPLRGAIQRLDAIAEADLTNPVPEAGKNEIGRLFGAMGTMQQNLTNIVGRVREGSNEIHHGTREIASGNADLFTYGAAGGIDSADRGQHGRDDRDGKTERR